MKKKKIAVLVGSLRKESFNRKLANEMIAMAPDDLDMELLEIGQLVHYNEDLDFDPPAEWVAFRKKIKDADGFLFFTPEYNRSVSGVLKNAIDIASRPYNQNNWSGKPGAIVSSSIGQLGGVVAHHALRQPLVALNVHMMQLPETYISNTMSLFGEDGKLVKEETRTFLRNYLQAFEAWVFKF